MLDAGQDAPARDALAQQARAQIEGGGTLKHENNWGLRKLAYEIAQRNEADYRWFRFEAAPELLEEIDHSLKITDGVLRFRIFKVDPEAPVHGPAGHRRSRPRVLPRAPVRAAAVGACAGGCRRAHSGAGAEPAADADSGAAAEPPRSRPPSPPPMRPEPAPEPQQSDASPAAPQPAPTAEPAE